MSGVPIAFALILVAIALLVIARRLRLRSGLPAGRVIYSDIGAWQRNERVLLSPTYGIAGKPDYLVRAGNDIVPVEVKSSPAPARPWPSHVLQLAAYCLLVEEALDARVTQGIIQYADKRFIVDYTPALKAELLRVVGEMRCALREGDAHRSHDEPSRCARCGARTACDERL
ncbi:CRISPR-associated protein Cas4 [Candidatus Roseilinea sp. NK_OTU-006]|jgi:CRISPR-associated exonuclease Cas4|uniref:CRISPR-associated protein Cas4 n=1 Tax=Candidatus Roseilinea sp. NK_OTU-006 TaxID=2704250 RepID=UPI00145D05DF|nr:CRISPR-associated protein Cas4 [Candidatus Roseilinea sp. NK_OTU-006]